MSTHVYIYVHAHTHTYTHGYHTTYTHIHQTRTVIPKKTVYNFGTNKKGPGILMLFEFFLWEKKKYIFKKTKHLLRYCKLYSVAQA